MSAPGTQNTFSEAIQHGSYQGFWLWPHVPITRLLRSTQSHTYTNGFNIILQFPVMQNAAAVVFQGEAEWGWPSLQLGATSGPVCILSRHSEW